MRLPRILLLGFALVPLFFLAYTYSQNFQFAEHDQFVAGSSRLQELNARLDRLVLLSRDRPSTVDPDQLDALLTELDALIATLSLPTYLPADAYAALEPMWQGVRAEVTQKGELVSRWQRQNQTYHRLLTTTPNLDRALSLALLQPYSENQLAVLDSLDASPLRNAYQAREATLDDILASPLSELGEDFLSVYVMYCEQVIMADRQRGRSLFVLFMLTTLAVAALSIRYLRQVDGAIQVAESRYRSLFMNAVEGIFQSTPSGKLTETNPALAKILKFDSPQELIKAYDDLNTQLYLDGDRRRYLKQLLEINPVVTQFESQVSCKDGAIIWVSENIRSVFNQKGELIGYEGTMTDITARKQAEETLSAEREKSEQLLLNILPQAIVARLKNRQSIIAESYTEATILFADIVDFTGLSAQISPAELVKLLNEIFTLFDAIADSLGLEKIKTIGDAYMVVGGLPMPRADHAIAVAEMALEMQQQIARISRPDGQPFQLRIGINTGPVVAGVIGTKKFVYDLWGDAVNVASRMESLGVGGEIQVTQATYAHLVEHFRLEPRGLLEVKGKGAMATFLLGDRLEGGTTYLPTSSLITPIVEPQDLIPCGVQRPGFPIAIGVQYRTKAYYRLESLSLGRELVLNYVQMRATRIGITTDEYLLSPTSEGYHLYLHQENLKTFPYQAALASICGQMREQIECSDRLWRLRVFSRCFVGNEAIDWLAEYLDCDRSEAVQVGKDCVRFKLIHHVLDEQDFVDDAYFYRFWQDGKPEKRLLSRFSGKA